MRLKGAIRPLLACLLLAILGHPRAQTDGELDRLAALETELSMLEAELARLEDSKAIKRLQRAYGYYLDAGLTDEIPALFAANASVELGGMGVYLGRERIGEFYERLLGGPLRAGELYNHMILQGVVHVADDGLTARGRWRAWLQTGTAGESATWIEGPYENEYIKEDGVWRFRRVHWYQTVAAPYAPGWHLEALPLLGPLEDLPPDLPPTEIYESFPGSYLTPFHYNNPVSGRSIEESR